MYACLLINMLLNHATGHLLERILHKKTLINEHVQDQPTTLVDSDDPRIGRKDPFE